MMYSFKTYHSENILTPAILFRFPGDSDNTIVTNYCISYTKQYIYLEKLKDKNKCTSFNVDFLGYLSHLKHVLIIKENICSKNNEKLKFDKFNIIYENHVILLE